MAKGELFVADVGDVFATCRSLQDSMIGIERAAKRMDDACKAAAKRMDDACKAAAMDDACKADAARADAEAILRDDSPLDDKIARVRALYDRPGTAGEKQASRVLVPSALTRLLRGTAMTNTKAHEELLAAILLAYRQQHPLPDSDLDDEQPVALSVRTTLGHLRALELEHLRALERLARAGGGS